ncbi:hypothetical protein DW778_11050 [Odoribacter splanchnicus]|uniref:hypothetical protein n=2 Tax=Odoribacter splanchnicus TaxID=28118 RepID=UPI000E593C23|nr:hypothetical protein [Odoribacter splanchnicus]RHD83271.1 hypothetical protein DW778_11050 [Odoribacter splanchnicus]
MKLVLGTGLQIIHVSSYLVVGDLGINLRGGDMLYDRVSSISFRWERLATDRPKWRTTHTSGEGWINILPFPDCRMNQQMQFLQCVENRRGMKSPDSGQVNDEFLCEIVHLG